MATSGLSLTAGKIKFWCLYVLCSVLWLVTSGTSSWTWQGFWLNPLPSDLHDRVWHKGKCGSGSGQEWHSSVECKGCLADSTRLAGIMTTQRFFSYVSVLSVIFEKNKKMATVIVSGDSPKRNMLSTLLRGNKLSILFTEMERVACFSFPGDGHSFLIWKDILIVFIFVIV